MKKRNAILSLFILLLAHLRPGRLYAPNQPLRHAAAATITLREVIPSKIFTPNGDGANDTFSLVVDNPAGSLLAKKKIYDIGGNEVADFQINGDETAAVLTLFWNGRDSNGNLVSSGIYIYQVRAESAQFSGTVVVAR